MKQVEGYPIKMGVHMRVASDVADATYYTAKGSMSWEVSGGATTEPTTTKRFLTPWDIAYAASEGDEKMEERWAEYVDVMPGTKSCVVSATLSEKLGISSSRRTTSAGTLEDEAHADDDDTCVGLVASSTWKKWLRLGLISTFLARVELYGKDHFEEALERTDSDATLLCHQIDAAWRKREYDYAIVRDRILADANEQRRQERILEIAKDILTRGPGALESLAKEVNYAQEEGIHISSEEVLKRQIAITRLDSEARKNSDDESV